MTTSPGTMKHIPPTRPPTGPRRRQAQKMASWVDIGPGSRLAAAMPCSNSSSEIHCLFSTQRSRSMATCVGGPPNPVQPILPHCRTIVPRDTWDGVALTDSAIAASL